MKRTWKKGKIEGRLGDRDHRRFAAACRGRGRRHIGLRRNKKREFLFRSESQGGLVC